MCNNNKEKKRKGKLSLFIVWMVCAGRVGMAKVEKIVFYVAISYNNNRKNTSDRWIVFFFVGKICECLDYQRFCATKVEIEGHKQFFCEFFVGKTVLWL